MRSFIPTAALCLLGVVYVHARNTQQEEQRNIARWEQLAAEVQAVDAAFARDVDAAL